MSRRPLAMRALEGAVELFNRNPWTRELHLLPREALPVPFYAEDGLYTYHRHVFTEDDRFLAAYRRGVQAAGWDYMIRWRVHTILWAAARGASLDGAFVECGTGRGFMASAICSYLAWNDRPFYLYDTFLPTALDESGVQEPDGEVLPIYARDIDEVRRNFSEWPGVQLVAGRIPATLLDTDRVAFLHIDLNHPDAEVAVVRHFWDRLTPGAPVVFDDYGFQGYEAQREAADAVAQELGFAVLTLPTGQGLVLR